MGQIALFHHQRLPRQYSLIDIHYNQSETQREFLVVNESAFVMLSFWLQPTALRADYPLGTYGPCLLL